MPTPIQTHLDNTKYSDLPQELDKLRCNVTFRSGRKFSIDSYEGELSYNEIVASVLANAKNYAGRVDGEALHRNLLKVHERGEEELSKQPLYIRIATYVVRLFTFWNRYWKLPEIQSMSGFNSLSLYAAERKTEVMQHVSDAGASISSDDIRFITHHANHFGNETRSVRPEIHISNDKQPQSYKGFDCFRLPEVAIDSEKTLGKHFEEVLEALKATLPLWFKARMSCDAIAQEIRHRVDALLFEYRQKQARMTPIVLSSVEANADIESTTVRYTFELHFVRMDIMQTTSKLKLTSDPVDIGDQRFVDQCTKKLIEQLNSKLPQFLNSSGRTSEFDDMFRSFFGGIPHFEEPAQVDPSLEIQTHIKSIEEILQKPNSLTTLYKNQEIDKLKQELKKANLQLHPDKVKQRGGSEEEIQAATEKIQSFNALVKKVLDLIH